MTEVTEAPAPATDPTTESIEAAVEAFRRQIDGHDSVSATVVQDGLLDIWGHLPEGDTRSVLERWITETLERNLYSVHDVHSRLATVLAPQG